MDRFLPGRGDWNYVEERAGRSEAIACSAPSQSHDDLIGKGEKKKDLGTISEPLRDALLAYSSLESNGADRAAVAQRLFGPAATRTLLPQLREICPRFDCAASARRVSVWGRASAIDRLESRLSE